MRNRTTRREPNGRAVSRAVVVLAALLLAITRAHAQAQPDAEALDRPGGESIPGRIAGDARSGFRFIPSGGGAPIALEPGATIHRAGATRPASPPASPATASAPPFHLLIGEAGRFSGSFRSLDGSRARFAPAWQPDELTLPRACVQAIVQRPGQARILAEPFDRIDPARWSVSGDAAASDRSPGDSGRCLRLGADRASATHSLEEPLAAGRLEVAFRDDGPTARGREPFVDLVFRAPSGPARIRIVLGRSEDGLSVESTAGPALQVQRLVRTPGWHRLTVRFGPDETEISIDGQELAHGRGPRGPLASLRLAVGASDGVAAPPLAAPGGPSPHAAEFDELSLIRLVEPPASLEIDPTQDEARLVIGDQIFGDLRSADAERMTLAVGGRKIPLRWGEVAGLYLHRVPAQGSPVSGLLVRAEWRSNPGGRPADVDFAEGALAGLSDESLTLSTPYSGTLTIPRTALARLAVVGRGRRIVVDVSSHHLGDEVPVTPPLLDPPQPDGLALDRAVDLPGDLADKPAELVLDVLQVVPEAGDTQYSLQVRKGELRTYAVVNGRRIDYVNRHVLTDNEAPERVRLAIPRGLLRPGKNSIRVELIGDSDPRPRFDDMGVLQIAVEFPEPAAAADTSPRPGPP